jgi:hypothetical protein
MLSCNVSKINSAMEQYAEWMLLLFYSYRCSTDLCPRVSIGKFRCVVKLREVYADDKAREVLGDKKLVFTARNLSILQNIQNSSYNSLRYKCSSDDLQSVTHSFCVKVSDTSELAEEHDDEEESNDCEAFLDHCDAENINDCNSSYLPMKLDNFSFRPLRNGGMHGCGYSTKIPSVTIFRAEDEWVFYGSTARRSNLSTLDWPVCDKPNLREVLNVYLRKTVRKARPTVFKRNKHAEVCEVNGSVESIFEWDIASRLDSRQRRSFELIISSFILAFDNFNDDEYNDPTVTGRLHTCDRNVKIMLAVASWSEQQWNSD